MVVRAVPVELLDRFLGGEATREVIRRCTEGPVIAKRGRNGSFSFPLVHPQVIQHTEALGIGPHIEENAFLYLDERDGTLEYVVAVGESRAIVGYGVFERAVGPAHLASAARLSIQYVYKAGSIQVVHVEDGLKQAHTPICAVEIQEEELERLVEKYAPKGVSDEEVTRRVAECTRELRNESAQIKEKNRDLEAQLGEVRAALTNKEARYAAREQHVQELEAALETAKAEGASKRELEELQRKYGRMEQDLAAERAAKGELEGKLAEEKERYASLDAAHNNFLAQHENLSVLLDRLENRAREIHILKEALAAAQAGAGKPAPYPPGINSGKYRFLYDLAKSLMRRCVERKRYTEDDTVGLGWSDAKLNYKPWTADINFYTLQVHDLPVIATSDPATNTDPLSAIRQVYYKASKEMGDFFPGFVMGKIPAYVVLFLQLTSLGPGPAKAKEIITDKLGFTPEQISEALQQRLFMETGSGGIEKLSLNATMRNVYTLFMKYRTELYQQCAEPNTSQSL